MIVAGFGFRAAATVDSLQSALSRVQGAHVIDALAAPEDKCAAPGLQGLSHELDLPVLPISAAALQAQETQTHSSVSQDHRKTGSVAEAAALAAAGPGATLIAPRKISEDRLATCSLARKNRP